MFNLVKRKNNDSLFFNIFDWLENDFSNLYNFKKPILSDIQENEKKYTIYIDVPGIKKEDLKVMIKNDVITISGERRNEKIKKSYYLGENIDSQNISSKLENGELIITLPKLKPEDITEKIIEIT